MKTIPKIDLGEFKILSPMEMNAIHFGSDKHSDRPVNNAGADKVPGNKTIAGSSTSTHKKLSDL